MDLRNQYLTAKYRLQGNGPRDICLLKEPFESMPENELTDIYGRGELIENFEKKFAEILGKQSAVFMPSGVMAQQIALRINADESGCKNVGYHPLSHLELHEQDAIRVVHKLNPVLLGERDRLFTLDDLKSVDEEVGTLLIELPQREMGGVLPEYEDLESIADFARSKGIRLHMDGARLLESLPYYKKTASEVSGLFDSVYISFYKGIGSIAGAILAGEKAFVEKAKIWKRRLGGDLISLYPYIVPADYYYEKRACKMQEYYINARELGEHFNKIPNITTMPETPVTNMFHVFVRMSVDKLKKIVDRVYEETKVSITNHIIEVDKATCKFEVSIGDEYAKIPKDLIKKVLFIINECLR